MTWRTPLSDVSITGPDGARVPLPVIAPQENVLFPQARDPGQRLAQAVAALMAGQEVCLLPPGGEPLPQQAIPGMLQCATSGSTGTPKRIRRSLNSWSASFDANAQQFGLGRTDRYAVLGDPAHSMTFYATAEAVFLGAQVGVLTGLRPSRQHQRLANATILYATPSQLRLTLPGAHLASMRHVFIGGGQMDEATAGLVARACPNARVTIFYGSSETSFVSITAPGDPVDTVGSPYPGVELSIRDQSGNSAGEGEIWVRSPYLFSDYANGHEPDTRWDGDYLTVGEMGRLDEQGRLYVLGRKSRMFTVADVNFYPEVVERWLMEQHGVEQAIVFPMPDPVRGQVPMAAVSGVLEPEFLLKRARRQLGIGMAPRKIHVVAAMPLLPSGKPDIQSLSGDLACL